MNKNNIFLSIIIPVYNAGKYLQECLDSCINQDFPDNLYEIICVNDGSTDNSPAILKDYEKKYNNIVVVNQRNQGASTARNKGIETAKGKYIWFVDSDDFISDGFIKEIYKNYYKNDYDMILFGAYAFQETLSSKDTEMSKMRKLRPNQAIQSVYITRRLIKRAYLDKHNIQFDEAVTYSEDSLFDYIIYVYNPQIEIFDRLGYFYRIHGGSLMRNKSYENKIIFINSHIRVIEIIKSYYYKEKIKRFRTIRYILDDLQTVFDVIATLSFVKAKEEIAKLQKIDVLPFKKLDALTFKDFVITLYTNVMCCIYSMLIRISTHKMGFCLLRYESQLMKGRRMKKILHLFKKKFSHLSKD